MKIQTETEYEDALLEMDDLSDCSDNDHDSLCRLAELEIAVEEYEKEKHPEIYRSFIDRLKNGD